MYRARVLRATVGAISVALVVAPITHADPATHFRSGTIVGGFGFEYAMDCGKAPDCRTWLQQGCPDQMTGVDPGLETSIVDVRVFANGKTRRLMELEAATPTGNVAGGVIVEFWKANCSPLSRPHALKRAARFAVPRGARWMTVVGSDNEFIRWWFG